MARYYIPQNVDVVMDGGRTHNLRAGLHEVPDDVLAHPYVKGVGIKPESEMTDADRYALDQIGVNVFPAVIDNRPESDVNRTSAADARDLVEALPGTPPTEVGDPARAPVEGSPREVPVAPKTQDDKPASPIPGPKPGK